MRHGSVPVLYLRPDMVDLTLIGKISGLKANVTKVVH